MVDWLDKKWNDRFVIALYDRRSTSYHLRTSFIRMKDGRSQEDQGKERFSGYPKRLVRAGTVLRAKRQQSISVAMLFI